MDTFLPTGALLIAEGTRLPASIQTATKAYVQGWRLAHKLDRRGLAQTIRQAGWKLFSLDATLAMTVFGFNDQKAVQKAIKRLAANVRSQSFNCLEIKQVETMRCLGFPYVIVSAHSWHIQEQVALGSQKAVEMQYPTAANYPLRAQYESGALVEQNDDHSLCSVNSAVLTKLGSLGSGAQK